MPSNCGAREDSWKLHVTARRSNPWMLREINPNTHWKEWCWSWSSNTLATWCKKLSPWKIPWCWKSLKAGEGDDRVWGGWMASPTRWTWACACSRSWWWTGKPGLLQSIGSQRVGHDWATSLHFMFIHTHTHVKLTYTYYPWFMAKMDSAVDKDFF